MYIHRIAQFNFPTDIDEIFEFMYEVKNFGEVLLQEIDPLIGLGKKNTEKSFHAIMHMTRNKNSHPFWIMNVLKNLDEKETFPYIHVYLKVKNQSKDYFIFIKIELLHLNFLINKYNFKKIDLKLK